MPFKNFSIWRGRLPHWRADDVRYYVTFRHRRDLDAGERQMLLRALLRPDGRRWDLLALCILPGQTELIFTVRDQPAGRPYELSGIVENAKNRVGKQIVKATGEHATPFYGESYDRIIREEAEFEERWQSIVDAPVRCDLVEQAEDWDGIWIAD